MATVLRNISEIRRFFHRNEDPIYFISATNFNLLGLDGTTALAMVGGGVLAGWGGAWTAVARHLAEIQPK